MTHEYTKNNQNLVLCTSDTRTLPSYKLITLCALQNTYYLQNYFFYSYVI